MKQSPVLIFECANAHGGEFDVLKLTINECAKIVYPRRHIKFQPFHPDTIALPDFSWYRVYGGLFFNQDQWATLIMLAEESFDGVWLDIFDRYGAEILAENAENVSGIKLQASVLENNEIFRALQEIPLAEAFFVLYRQRLELGPQADGIG